MSAIFGIVSPGTYCLFFSGYESLAALLYTIGSVGFASVDFQELLTFEGGYLRTNICLSLIGSIFYIIGSVVSVLAERASFMSPPPPPLHLGILP